MGVAEVASGTAAAGVAGAGLAAEVPSGEGAGLPVAGLQGGRECEHAISAMGGMQRECHRGKGSGPAGAGWRDPGQTLYVRVGDTTWIHSFIF